MKILMIKGSVEVRIARFTRVKVLVTVWINEFEDDCTLNRNSSTQTKRHEGLMAPTDKKANE